jgi:hypothetical protein
LAALVARKQSRGLRRLCALVGPGPVVLKQRQSSSLARTGMPGPLASDFVQPCRQRAPHAARLLPRSMISTP